MPWVGFEPTIPAFKRAKTVYALDRAATVIGVISSFVICAFHYYQNDQTKKDKMDGSCVQKQERRDHFEGLGVDGRKTRY
jgi:hypothetical protein